MSLIELRGISKQYKAGVAAVHSTNESISPSAKIGLVGETGSGKSTMLKMIGGLVQPDTGKIMFKDQKVLGPDEQLLAGHSNISYLSQHFELQKFVDVSQFLDRFSTISKKDSLSIYHDCNIIHLLEKDTRELSGGEKQRVALAKELIQSPSVLLLDEPFSNLDLNHKRSIKEAISAIEKKWVDSILMASHDPLDVLPWADIIWVFQSGSIIQKGTPEEIYNQPINEYVAGLFGSYNLIDSSHFPQLNLDHYSTINGKILIRPEQLILTSTDKNLAAGRVTAIHYHGSYEEIHIRWNNETLIANVDHRQFSVGDATTIGIKNGSPLMNP